MSGSETRRADYLRALRIAVNARSPWLLRDLVEERHHILGPLAPVLMGKTDDELAELLEETARVMNGASSHQLASQLAAPWLVGRKH